MNNNEIIATPNDVAYVEKLLNNLAQVPINKILLPSNSGNVNYLLGAVMDEYKISSTLIDEMTVEDFMCIFYIYLAYVSEYKKDKETGECPWFWMVFDFSHAMACAYDKCTEVHDLLDMNYTILYESIILLKSDKEDLEQAREKFPNLKTRPNVSAIDFLDCRIDDCNMVWVPRTPIDKYASIMLNAYKELYHAIIPMLGIAYLVDNPKASQVNEKYFETK